MKSIARVTLTLCVSLAWPSLHAAADNDARSFRLDDLHKLTRLSEPQISPDGQRIAVIASTPDWASDQRRQQIDLVDAASGAVRVLTWQRKQLSMPRWSPDGSRPAFLAEDTGTKQVQVFVLPMDGGDASRITTAAEGVDGYVVPARDAEALRARLQQLADDPDRVVDMGRWARVKAAACADWSAYGDLAFSTYTELLQ